MGLLLHDWFDFKSSSEDYTIKEAAGWGLDQNHITFTF